jgi:hypothetical protein
VVFHPAILTLAAQGQYCLGQRKQSGVEDTRDGHHSRSVGEHTGMVWFYVGFRILYIALAVLLVTLMWRRPRAAFMVSAVLLLNILAWCAYTAPLPRLYALLEERDRIVNVGEAAVVAAGNSPWERAQVGEAALEPFWTVVIASLALFRPEAVVSVFNWLPVLALVSVAAGLYLGLRHPAPKDETARWEAAFIVFAVLGLSSLAMTARSPIPPFWAGNFLLKPNHAAAFGLVGIVVGMSGSRRPMWQQGALLGLLGWAFLMSWGLVVAGLIAGELLQTKAERRLANTLGAIALSAVLVSPVLTTIATHYSPSAETVGVRGLWKVDEMAQRLGYPDLLLGDLGPGLPLAAFGIWILFSRGRRIDRLLLGLIASAAAIWVFVTASSHFGFAPEPDEVFYNLRFTLAVAMGIALAGAARCIEKTSGLVRGKSYLAVFACCVPFTFPAYWDPPTMDRYFEYLLTQVPRNIVQYTNWIRSNTPANAVFAATPTASFWIPALAGRRVLQSGNIRPPVDHVARQEAMSLLMTSQDAAATRVAAGRYGVTYLAVDWDATRETSFAQRRHVLRPVFFNARVRIFELAP